MFYRIDNTRERKKKIPTTKKHTNKNMMINIIEKEKRKERRENEMLLP